MHKKIIPTLICPIGNCSTVDAKLPLEGSINGRMHIPYFLLHKPFVYTRAKLMRTAELKMYMYMRICTIVRSGAPHNLLHLV